MNESSMNDEAIKDFHVIVKIKNNQLVERRESYGASVSQMAEDIGVSYSCYLAYENMKSDPYSRANGEWKDTASKIAGFFGVTPSELWSDSVLSVRGNVAVRKFNSADIGLLTGGHTERLALPPSVFVEEREMKDGLVKMMQDNLTAREIEILTKFYGLNGVEKMTLADIGESLERPASRERVRQIQLKAERKLCWSGRSDAMHLMDLSPKEYDYICSNMWCHSYDSVSTGRDSAFARHVIKKRGWSFGEMKHGTRLSFCPLCTKEMMDLKLRIRKGEK